jgi:hypothetical protein
VARISFGLSCWPEIDDTYSDSSEADDRRTDEMIDERHAWVNPFYMDWSGPPENRAQIHAGLDELRRATRIEVVEVTFIMIDKMLVFTKISAGMNDEPHVAGDAKQRPLNPFRYQLKPMAQRTPNVVSW